jgi:hypothetical protein
MYHLPYSGSPLPPSHRERTYDGVMSIDPNTQPADPPRPSVLMRAPPGWASPSPSPHPFACPRLQSCRAFARRALLGLVFVHPPPGWASASLSPRSPALGCSRAARSPAAPCWASSLPTPSFFSAPPSDPVDLSCLGVGLVGPGCVVKRALPARRSFQLFRLVC